MERVDSDHPHKYSSGGGLHVGWLPFFPLISQPLLDLNHIELFKPLVILESTTFLSKMIVSAPYVLALSGDCEYPENEEIYPPSALLALS